MAYIKSVDLSPITIETESINENVIQNKGLNLLSPNSLMSGFKTASIDANAWTSTTSGTATISIATSGVYRLLEMKASANGSYACINSKEKVFSKGDGEITLKFNCYGNNTAGYFMFGLANAVNGWTDTIAFYSVDTDISSVVMKNSTDTTTSIDTKLSGWAGAINKEYKIVINSDWTSISFYVDDVLKGTTTTNIPDDLPLYVFTRSHRTTADNWFYINSVEVY